MDTISMATAAVTGSRHLRAARNGQDAVAAYRNAETGVGVVVVADGCGSAASSEVGAGLGARLFARAVGELVARRAGIGRESQAGDIALSLHECFASARVQVGDVLRGLIGTDIRDGFLFTLVAAVTAPQGAAVWALGDGAYSFGDRTRVLGPFVDNQPPYLAYDLLGDAREAHFELAPAHADTIIIATDGASDLLESRGRGIEDFASVRNLSHPDALRRELTVLARGGERIDWDLRRVIRTPAVLQDDCAVGVLRWRRAWVERDR